MHKDQDNILPRPTVGKGVDSKMRSCNEFTDIAREDLFKSLRAAI